MKLYYHPRSTYSQKVLIALHEKGAAFTPAIVTPSDPQQRAELLGVTPLGKIPVLVLDDGWKIPESTIIIEYLDGRFGGTRLIPDDRDLARQTRFHDRIADLYVNDSISRIYFEARKPEPERDAAVVAAARQRLDTLFPGLDARLAERPWVMGDSFTMADCALIPALGYCRMLHPFDRWQHLAAYAQRALERPSVRAVQAELEPYLVRVSA
jgi:glutathione S-transferase